MDGPLVVQVEKRLGSARLAVDLTLPLAGAPVTVLFGPSGAGKTTLLRLVAGLDRPDRGTVRLGDTVWAGPGRFVPPWGRGVGLLFQDHALFPHLTVAGNLAYGLGHLPRRARAGRVAEVAARLGLEGLLARRVAGLSGGQAQRVALARALAPHPRLLLLDEPLSALDAPTREGLRRTLRAQLVASRVPALVVTHDRTEALVLGDRVAVMVEGAIRQVGAVAEVFARPADVGVARVVGTENLLPGRVVSRQDGLAEVACGEARLVAVCAHDPGPAVWACIRAEDVILEAGGDAPTSARNLLRGRVARLTPEGPLVRVELSAGVPLVALVTRGSVARLGLAPGVAVGALIKAPAVRLVPRPERAGDPAAAPGPG